MSEVRYQDTLRSSRQDHKLAYSSDIYDDTSGMSVGERLADVGDKVDKAIPRIDKLEEQLPAEAKARKEADDALQKNIDTEAENRQSADVSLQENIDAESKSRQLADNELQGNLDTESDIRKEADNTLQENIDAEAKERTDGDAALEKSLGDFKESFVDVSYDEYEALEASGKTASDTYYFVFE